MPLGQLAAVGEYLRGGLGATPTLPNCWCLALSAGQRRSGPGRVDAGLSDQGRARAGLLDPACRALMRADAGPNRAEIIFEEFTSSGRLVRPLERKPIFPVFLRDFMSRTTRLFTLFWSAACACAPCRPPGAVVHGVGPACLADAARARRCNLGLESTARRRDIPGGPLAQVISQYAARPAWPFRSTRR